jgi:phage antirepressor YoqD-like protein
MMVIAAKKEKERLQLKTQMQQKVITSMVPKAQCHDQVFIIKNLVFLK